MLWWKKVPEHREYNIICEYRILLELGGCELLEPLQSGKCSARCVRVNESVFPLWVPSDQNCLSPRGCCLCLFLCFFLLGVVCEWECVSIVGAFGPKLFVLPRGCCLCLFLCVFFCSGLLLLLLLLLLWFVKLSCPPTVAYRVIRVQGQASLDRQHDS